MITLAELHALLDYSPDTGVFIWRSDCKYGSRRRGDVAGSISGRGYRRVMIKGKGYASHRLAWFYHFGVWPTKHIDHINHVRSDNRIVNLREATILQNAANKPGRAGSRSGLKGVVPNGCGRWAARIRIAGRMTHIGTFDTAHEASAAYLVTARSVHGDFAYA